MIRVSLIICALVLAGCTNNPTTDPLANIIIQETKVPVGVCPVGISKIEYPTKPALAIDALTVTDRGDFNKVGKAYMQTVADQQHYIKDLEDIVYSIRDTCQSINTSIIGK